MREMLTTERAEFLAGLLRGMGDDMFVGTEEWMSEKGIGRDEVESLLDMAVRNVRDREYDSAVEMNVDFVKSEVKRPGEQVRCTVLLDDSDVAMTLSRLCAGGPARALVIPSGLIVDGATGEVL